MTETALIIAAGMGTRLADKSGLPKPLRKVGGIPLIKRILLLCAKAGMKKAVIVVGFKKDQIINYINNEEWPLQVEFVHNDEWKKSNGISVLAAKEVIHEDFVLLMSDHVFDYTTLQKLRRQNLDDVDLKLAVDYNLNDVFWMEDATKVQLQSQKIAEIDKQLTKFDAVDTGMFLISPKFFTVLENAKKDGDCSLSDGVRALANEGKAGTYDIGKAFWQDVDDFAGLKHAEKQLLQACRKPTDGFISRHFNRYVSLFFSKYLVKTPVSANFVTLMVALIGLGSGYFAMKGGYVNYIIAGFLFLFASIADGIDGEISRLKLTSSQMGQWFDTVSDNITYFAFFLGTSLGLYQTDQIGLLLASAPIIGLSFILIIMYFYLVLKTDSGSLLVIQQDLHEEANQSFFKKTVAQIQLVMKRDFFAVLFFVFALIGKPLWVLYCVTLFTNIGWIYLLTFVFKRMDKVSTANLAPSRQREQDLN